MAKAFWRWLAQWRAMAVKEIRVVLLDKRARTTLISSPLIQLFLFGLATTLEVTNVDVGVVDRDNGQASEQVMAGLSGTRQIDELRRYATLADLDRAIERREIIAGIAMPPDLSKDIALGRQGTVLVLLDGRRINAARVTESYISAIVQRAGADVSSTAAKGEGVAGPQLIPTHWFNRNLDYRWFTLPGMIAVITSVLVVSVGVQSFARERELGTMGQLVVLPLTPLQILLGKMVPAFIVGLVNAVTYTVLIPIFFSVPFEGSLALMFAAIAVFSLSIVGLAMFVSVLANNQQQAFLGGFLLSVPMILLSGYVSPIDNIPAGLNLAAQVNPLQHMVFVSQGIFLKDIGADIVWPRILTGLGVGSAAFLAALFVLNRRHG